MTRRSAGGESRVSINCPEHGPRGAVGRDQRGAAVALLLAQQLDDCFDRRLGARLSYRQGGGARQQAVARAAALGGRGAIGKSQKARDLLARVAPVTAAVDAQACQDALVGPGTDCVGVNTQHPRGIADGQELGI